MGIAQGCKLFLGLRVWLAAESCCTAAVKRLAKSEAGDFVQDVIAYADIAGGDVLRSAAAAQHGVIDKATEVDDCGAVIGLIGGSRILAKEHPVCQRGYGSALPASG